MKKDLEKVIHVGLLCMTIGVSLYVLSYCVNGFDVEAMNNSGITQMGHPFTAIGMIITILLFPIIIYEKL